MNQKRTDPMPAGELSIAEALEACRARLEQGATVEACLATYPAHADELRVLLPLAVSARRLAPSPDPLAVDRSRRRFRAYLEEKRGEAQRTSGARAWLLRLAGPVLAVIILTVSSLGLAQASANTLPDNPLYTVKQARESLGQFLTVTPAARASYQITIARRRLIELNRAEALRKPNVARVSALGMVDATQRAVNNTRQADLEERKLLEARLHPLIQDELRSLATLEREAPPQYAAAIRQAEQRLKDDETLMSR